MIRINVLVPLFFLTSWLAQAQTVTTFEGIDASQVGHPEYDVDPNGAVGTKQYMEWTNVNFQAFDKVTFAPVWSSPLAGTSPWVNNGMQGCGIAGDGVVLFDHLASRWVIAGHNAPGAGLPYYYCVAVSSTDDLSSNRLSWYTYQFELNPVLGVNSFGHPYFPDWPKLGTWWDGYYVSFDLTDVDNHYQEIGVLACALDRTNMLTGGVPNAMQCFSDPSPIPTTGSLYLGHSLVAGDVEGVTAPPVGRHEYFVSIENPPADGHSTTSKTINLWDFHVDWVTPTNSTFTHSGLPVTTYNPGCYNTVRPGNTFCVLQPAPGQKGGHYKIDSVGDRLMPRMAYRNFGTYESWLVSQTVKVGIGASNRTGIRWYELRGSGTPAIYQSGTLNPDTALFRFMPSMAQDHSGNAALGYSVSSATVHPGIKGAWWNLTNPKKPVELWMYSGSGDSESAMNWGDYTSMTVDPVDDCTFWYVNQYLASNQTGPPNWNTRIANFKLSTCTSLKKMARTTP
jgi:hypothetical protein